ncbi:L,D-transpeptidase [Aureimonas mangrovi]|uniref:L,D-transpeptidase n=1 Tax=Aureimonas mangrovi TaxID=2758041 RepID=UPI00163D9595|nr:L,D-transpeptidase [Aureimonas mangrovi]
MRNFAIFLAAALLVAGTSGASARDDYVRLDQRLAAERVLQLSPSAGVAIEYKTPPTVYSHPDGQVVFQGNIPVGVVGPGGVVVPLGQVERPRRKRIVPTSPQFVAPRGHPVVVAPKQEVAVVTPPVRTMQPHATRTIDPAFLPTTVVYEGPHRPGTVVIDTRARYLYLVEPNGRAMRYGVGVGKEGFSWKGSETITRKAEWPGWTPPRQMIARERARGVVLPAHMPGEPDNPLGARALYLGDTLYRIHGTNQPWTIGQAVSSGCIRMRNEDVIDLYGRVPVGARVVVF